MSTICEDKPFKKRIIQEENHSRRNESRRKPFMADATYYMKQALQEAQKAFERGEVPVGAVVVCRDRIIARAHNLTETLNDVTAHAEMQAITAAANTLGGKYLNECTLYVTVEPCVMCAGAIGWSQLGALVFGAEDPKRGYQRFAPQALHPKTVVTKGLLAEEASKLMVDFFKRKR
jgi:tRNA(adenine34) deaminase